MNQSAQAFYAAREFLLTPPRGLRHGLPRLPLARDHGVQLGARPLRRRRAARARRPARRCGSSSRTASEAHWTFAELSARSNQVANWLRDHGVARGDRVILMLGNQVELWETMLAAMKLGAVVIPATTLLDGGRPARPARPGQRQARRRRRGGRGQVRRRRRRLHEDRGAGRARRAGATTPTPPARPTTFTPDGVTQGSDTLLLYFTSGTTAKPKLVEHTHASYPVGHLSTMYWIGLEPGDVHLNISSPGWAKHAWSNVFAPWIAEACVLVMNYAAVRRGESVLGVLDRCGVTSFCAPPTVWRMLIQADLSGLRHAAVEGGRGGGAAQPRGDRAGREGVGRPDPRRVRPDRDDRADRQPARPDGQARLDGPSDPRLPDRAGRPGHGRAGRARRARSASTSPSGRSG